MTDSIRRQQELESRKNSDTKLYEAYQMLNDKDKEVFSSKYDASAGTIHTAAYIPKEKKAYFAIGGDQLPVIFDFNRYLNGERINIKRIKGKLSYHKPFVNMKII